MDNTRVACWDLGYDKKTKVAHYFTFANYNAKIWRNDIECAGKEASLRECPVKYRPYSTCTRLVHVKCNGKCKLLLRIVGILKKILIFLQ